MRNRKTLLIAVLLILPLLLIAAGPVQKILTDLDMTSHEILNLASPTTANSAVSKSYSTNATNLVSGTVATSRLGSGVADTTTYLRGDNSWATPPSSSSAVTISAKTANYTVVAGDLGTIINCTSNSFTVSLTAAATLGSGFWFDITNSSTTATHAITVDPNSSETIDGSTTMILRRGESVRLLCNGSSWQIMSRGYGLTVAFLAASNPTKAVASAANAIAIGSDAQALSTSSTAIGTSAIASGANAIAIGLSSSASNSGSLAIGADTGSVGSSSSGQSAIALMGGTASGEQSVAIGSRSTTRSIAGATARSIGRITTTGDAQVEQFVLRRQSTAATPVILTTDNGAAGTTNQVVLPNNSTYTFEVTVTAHRTDVVGSYASYRFFGIVTRGASAGTTAIQGTYTKDVLGESDAAYDCEVSADTTNGALGVTWTGKASQTFTVVAEVKTVEATS